MQAQQIMEITWENWPDGLGSTRVSLGLIEYAQNMKLVFFLCHIAFFNKMRNELENDTWINLQHSLALDSFGNRIGEAEHIMLLLCSARFLNIEASLQSVFY